MIDEEFKEMSYDELVHLTLKEAEQIEDTKKKRVIILAKKLENVTPKEMISQKISRDLRGWVNSRYVRDCLGEAYKDKKQVREQNTSQVRESTTSVEDKKVIVNITNKGKQETANEYAIPCKQTVNEIDFPTSNDDITTIESLQNKIKILEQRRDYYARKLVEKSPDFSELYQRISQLEEIESERIKHNDFMSAASLPVKNELQKKIESLQNIVNEQSRLLAKTRFEAHLEIMNQVIPLIIFINRATERAKVIVKDTKFGREHSK